MLLISFGITGPRSLLILPPGQARSSTCRGSDMGESALGRRASLSAWAGSRVSAVLIFFKEPHNLSFPV